MNRARLSLQTAHGLTLLLLVWRLGIFLRFGWRALTWRYELDYGEGIVWQQADMMLTPEAYGGIDGFPAIVFHYPPLYHLATRAVSALAGVDMLFAGRAISIGSMLLAALMVAAIIMRTIPGERSRASRISGCVAGGLLVFSFAPVSFWPAFMRVDTLAVALGLGGFWLGLKAFERPALIYPACLFFVAAVFTKQTALPAPAAVFLLMLWLRPGLAIRGILTCLVAGIAIAAILGAITHGGFLRHILAYNINTIDLGQINLVIQVVENNVVFFALAILAIWWRISRFRARNGAFFARCLQARPADIAWTGVLFYLATTSLMLVTILKSGSSVNYMLEWVMVVAILVGSGVADTLAAVRQSSSLKPLGNALVAGSFAIPAMLAAQILLPGIAEPNFDRVWSGARAGEMAALSEKIRDASKPVISDDMVILRRSGKPVLWEPAIFTQLAKTGAWDAAPFVARILAGDFALFLTVGDRGDPLYDSRYSEAIADAMDRAYPVREHLAGYTLHMPTP